MKAGIDNAYPSWGRYPTARHRARAVVWRDAAPRPDEAPVLPRGRGRSYGDACLNDGGMLLLTHRLNRFLAFDASTGRLRAEPGATVGDVLDVAMPHGWSLPVVPGTRHVTLGGAVANDVHGKNHHRMGSFGRHVKRLELARSDGARIECGPDDRPEWFRATVAGLGLTGLITWVEIQLQRVPGAWFRAAHEPFADLAAFFDLSRDASRAAEHTVAWVDGTPRGARRGRGVFFRGDPAAHDRPPPRRRAWRVPFDAPSGLLGPRTMGAASALYRLRHQRPPAPRLVPYDRFLFPLDGIEDWNRLYGAAGFVQYQCVVPHATAHDAILAILDLAAASRTGSFLTVLKVFGDHEPPGLLSFPRPGVTLALDFPISARPLPLLDRFDAVVADAGGAVYLAKDARMGPATFRAGHPRWREFVPFVDPACSSSLWRRLGGAS